ncbi:hypothetical protein DYBT9275_05669 [Dyadobacter sp. CECT 9275]|uniref:Heparan-alpha-glucosaminide N-acetyltransferase catalytic domain-containing protein n=1 Tax=Dyadobacter helix TaxID=2822344 RepID=A0A916JGN6_9BACT|nr:heparan-alpha-glucosaminide N-acetyltransferase domain-containing protein [Dyadobacter sp. CECT 9275]CAG5016945.1 hypothetical protein DYBT9275_05669 [Dyadobacter sp. CECT 9275]
MATLIKSRVTSIDLLKGIVMVMMALDHTRDYFYQSSTLSGVTDPAHATWAVYLTRWVTHLCAPTFSFLAGISAYLSGKRKTKAELSGFLVKRGLWLVLMELTIINYAWYLNVWYNNIDLAVIWVLGISMLFLAGFVYLPRNVILLISCVLIFGHNLLDNVHFERSLGWSILHEFSSFQISDTRTINVVYPILPWIAVMALGYCFGRLYDQDIQSDSRKKLFSSLGLAAVTLFVFIRWANSYGDPAPWVRFETTGQTLMSFFNVTKYPPSLLYLLVTLSCAFLFMANSEKWSGKAVDFFIVFGRVPFFYYILHLYTIRLLSMVVAGLTGHGWDLMVQTTFDVDLKTFGFNLGVVYLIWIGIILALYPVCKKFDRYKQSHREKWWLSYL